MFKKNAESVVEISNKEAVLNLEAGAKVKLTKGKKLVSIIAGKRTIAHGPTEDAAWKRAHHRLL